MDGFGLGDMWPDRSAAAVALQQLMACGRMDRDCLVVLYAEDVLPLVRDEPKACGRHLTSDYRLYLLLFLKN